MLLFSKVSTNPNILVVYLRSTVIVLRVVQRRDGTQVELCLTSPCLVPSFVEHIHSLAIEPELELRPPASTSANESQHNNGEAAVSPAGASGNSRATQQQMQIEQFTGREVAALMDSVADQEGIYWLGNGVGTRLESASSSSFGSESMGGERCGPASPPDRISHLFHSLLNFEPSRLEARSILPSLFYNDH